MNASDVPDLCRVPQVAAQHVFAVRNQAAGWGRHTETNNLFWPGVVRVVSWTTAEPDDVAVRVLECRRPSSPTAWPSAT